MNDYIVSELVDLLRVGWVTTITLKSGVVVSALGSTQAESRDNALSVWRRTR